MTAKWTGWIKDPPIERQYRYPMFAAAHAVSLIKNGGVSPQDFYWVHYGGGFKVLNLNTHVDEFCNLAISSYRGL